MNPRLLIPAALIVAASLVIAATLRDAKMTATVAAMPKLPPSFAGTSRDELASTVAIMTARVKMNPADGAAVVSLADSLVRLQRVNHDGHAVIAAEEQLRALLKRHPGHYDAHRMLAVVLLSQHRFAEAVAEANRAMAMDPRDAWNYGAAGDGYMELGDYTRAFEAFDRMGQLQPGPPAYARVSYALEIKGELDEALDYMRRAADGTSPNDPESQAWHYSQAGELLLQLGRVVEARLQFERADATFPNHPLAMTGRARVAVATGDLSRARLLLQQALGAAPSSEWAMTVGDLSRALGDATGAASYYRMAEQIERSTWQPSTRQPQVLARFFAEHDINLGEAVQLAEEAARTSTNIYTMDTLAFAYLKAGRLADAERASSQALRTGSRDARILWHAAELAYSRGDLPRAQATLDRIATSTTGDVVVDAGIAGLRQRLAN